MFSTGHTLYYVVHETGPLGTTGTLMQNKTESDQPDKTGADQPDKSEQEKTPEVNSKNTE